jgi:hypothetical protein
MQKCSRDTVPFTMCTFLIAQFKYSLATSFVYVKAIDWSVFLIRHILSYENFSFKYVSHFLFVREHDVLLMLTNKIISSFLSSRKFSHFHEISRKCSRKLSRKYENFRANAKMFAKIVVRKLTLIAESLLMWNTWGMGHQIEYCLLK